MNEQHDKTDLGYRQLQEVISRQPYPLVFATVSGAHLYGFPSADSDYDLRGCHLLPVQEVVGLDRGTETIEWSAADDGLEIDLVTHDAAKFFNLLLRKNGYVLEQLYSPLVVHQTPEHSELKSIAEQCITRHHHHHYRGFAETQWRLFVKEDPPRVKPLLYVYRVLLTGIHLMRTGLVEANLVCLNEEAQLAHVDDLIARKLAGPEASALNNGDMKFHRGEYDRLQRAPGGCSFSQHVARSTIGQAGVKRSLGKVADANTQSRATVKPVSRQDHGGKKLCGGPEKRTRRRVEHKYIPNEPSTVRENRNMAAATSRAVLRHLNTLFQCGAAGQLSDSELIERFVAGRDEAAQAAFAALVERHGVMVLGVCRRVLGDRGEAEDAFQATFVVLAKKASSIAGREQLASWLYGVARRAALDARARAGRRKAREQRLKAMLPAEPPDQTITRELRAVLDEELAHLPERHRTAILLCELEGLSRREAALRLGVSEGTLSSRLARAKARLRDRLTRRGFALTTAALATVLAQDAQGVILPPVLLDSTVRVATLVAAGSTLAEVVSASVVTLTEGVLKAMLLAKLKYVFLGLATLTLISSSVGVVAQSNPTPKHDDDRLQSVERKLDKLLEVLGGTNRPLSGGFAGGGAMIPAPPVAPSPPGAAPVPALPGANGFGRMGGMSGMGAMPGTGGGGMGGGMGPMRGGMGGGMVRPSDLANRVDRVEKRLDDLERRITALQERLGSIQRNSGSPKLNAAHVTRGSVLSADLAPPSADKPEPAPAGDARSE